MYTHEIKENFYLNNYNSKYTIFLNIFKIFLKRDLQMANYFQERKKDDCFSYYFKKFLSSTDSGLFIILYFFQTVMLRTST